MHKIVSDIVMKLVIKTFEWYLKSAEAGNQAAQNSVGYKVSWQNSGVSTSVEIGTSFYVLPIFFINGKTTKVSTGGKSFDGWQKLQIGR